jgi:hypothetical protein
MGSFYAFINHVRTPKKTKKKQNKKQNKAHAVSYAAAFYKCLTACLRRDAIKHQPNKSKSKAVRSWKELRC